jgi:hypothetical protein
MLSRADCCKLNGILGVVVQLQVPYENYRKIFRISQKCIEKELASVQISANELAVRAAAGDVEPESAVATIEAMIARVENLKQKVSTFSSPWILCTSYGTLFMSLKRSARRIARDSSQTYIGRAAGAPASSGHYRPDRTTQQC